MNTNYDNDERGPNPHWGIHDEYIDQDKDIHALYAADLGQLRPGLTYHDYPTRGHKEKQILNEVVAHLKSQGFLKDHDMSPLRKVSAWTQDLRNKLNRDIIPSIKDFRKLAEWRDLIKVATPDSDFEQSFFQLAYEKLQEKLYNLLPYLVGFEIVNKSDDGTKALGVFGFKSNNDQIIYVPAFFVNGTVKGIDILYSKNNEQFYPLNEDFAEMFLKDDATGIGDASHESRKQINQGTTPIDLRDLVRPPRTGKVSYASVMDFVEEGDEMTKKAFHQLFTQNDSFMESILRFYPLEKVAKAVVPTKKEAAMMGLSIRIFTASSVPVGAPDEVKSQIATKGYCIQDSRLDEAKSKFGLTKYPETFTNPTESGFYSYLTESGNLRYGMIFTKLVKLNPHFATDEAIVMDLKSGNSYREQLKNIYVRTKYEVKDYSEVHNKMTEIAEAEPSFDKQYILVNESLVASLPFRVRSNSKDDLRKIEIETTGITAPVGTSTSGKKLQGNFDTKPDRFRTATLILTKKPGDVPTVNGGMVYIPKGFKLMEVDFMGPTSGEDGGMTKWRAGRPGGLAALSGALAERRVFPMTVRSNGSEYFVNVGAAKRKYPNALKAKIALVTEVGLGEKEAEELIDSVVPMSKKEGYVKLAEHSPLTKYFQTLPHGSKEWHRVSNLLNKEEYTSESEGRNFDENKVLGKIKKAYTGDYTAQLHDPQPYSNELGQPTYDGVGYEEQMPPDQQYQGNPTQIGLGTMPNIEGINQSVSQASQLAQNGQKQIFDTHSVATLAKYVSPSSKVQGYMPDFISCLDKLGRMLFLVYWETDKFEEMYGRSELPELVELITNVFKNLGDLVVFLKRKSPEISINMEKDELGS